MNRYFYKNTLLGIKINKLLSGSRPQTKPEEAVGILTFKHRKGAHFAAHKHQPKTRVTHKLEECFIVKRGKIAMKLFGPDNRWFKTITVSAGELFLSMAGGHDITVLEDCELFEVKNGPYSQDKVTIEKTA